MKSRVILLVLFSVAAVVLLGLGLMQGNLFKVRTVEIVCDDISENDIKYITDSSQIKIGQSVFDINKDNVSAAVNSVGEYYAEEIIIVYPSTVKITVKKRIPAAIIEYENGFMIIDSSCNVIKIVSDVRDYDLVRFAGIRVSQYSIGGVITTKDEYQKSIISTCIDSFGQNGTSDIISVVSLEDFSNMYLISTNGKRIDLCEAVDVNNKLTWLTQKELREAIFDDEEHEITLYNNCFVIK